MKNIRALLIILIEDMEKQEHSKKQEIINKLQEALKLSDENEE